MQFKVTKQFNDRAELFCAEFDDLNDAVLFIENAVRYNISIPAFFLFVHLSHLTYPGKDSYDVKFGEDKERMN